MIPISTLLLLAFFCVGLVLLLVRDSIYRWSKKETGIEVNKTVEFVAGDAIIPVVSGLGVQQASLVWSNAHQPLIALILFIASAIAALFSMPSLSVGLLILSLCFFASWYLQKWVHGYNKNATVSQIIFIILILSAIGFIIGQFWGR
jgi:predicted membrane protein